jgi:hypothetical protein
MLASAGYTDEHHTEGWTLLERASGRKAAPPAGSDKTVMEAIAELDRWDEKGIRRVKAILKRHHPDQNTFVCTDLEPGRGGESVLSVAKLLGRIQALRDSPDREDTREADHAALATLASRKLDDALWTRLGQLVRQAQHPAISTAPVSTGPSAVSPDPFHDALLALHAWYMEWSAAARSEITRRDYLIRLGLARRKSRSEESIDDDSDDESPTEVPGRPPT